MNFNFDEIECWRCGISFRVRPSYLTNRKKYHEGVFCPNGHKNYFYDETEEEKLQKEIEFLKRSRDNARKWEKFAERSASAYKGQITKLKKQLKNKQK